MFSCYSVCSVSFRQLKTLHHLPLLYLNIEIGHFCFIWNCEEWQGDSDLWINKVYLYSSNVCITVDAYWCLCRWICTYLWVIPEGCFLTFCLCALETSHSLSLLLLVIQGSSFCLPLIFWHLVADHLPDQSHDHCCLGRKRQN